MATEASNRPDEVLSLVHQGWRELRLQRPLAAWACWQRALRIDPDDEAARQALAILASADELPLAARTAYRFRPPLGEARRVAWDTRLRGIDASDLAVAAEVFLQLAADEPGDLSAWYNAALCLAWQGLNPEAIGALDRFVSAAAAQEADLAAEAWGLAEILRQGAGAEFLADDLSHSLTLAWEPDDPDVSTLGYVERVAPPAEPSGAPSAGNVRIYEWLDRPMPEASDALKLSDLPRVLATLIRTEHTTRFSSPEPRNLAEAEARLPASVVKQRSPARREATPLPLPMLDAAVWTVRMPSGLDPEARRCLSRSAVEHDYENRWLHIPRHGLGGLTPLQASRLAAQGDAAMRCKLVGIVRIREQLGARVRSSELYGGYPFDRLRRRLGLEADRSETVDSADVSCMSQADLDRLDPRGLDEVALAEAYESAAGLGDDASSARFAGEVVERPAGIFSRNRIDPVRLFASLVRAALSDNRPDRALEWLDRAVALDREINQGRLAPTYATWRTEILEGAGSPSGAAPQATTHSDAAISLGEQKG